VAHSKTQVESLAAATMPPEARQLIYTIIEAAVALAQLPRKGLDQGFESPMRYHSVRKVKPSH